MKQLATFRNLFLQQRLQVLQERRVVYAGVGCHDVLKLCMKPLPLAIEHTPHGLQQLPPPVYIAIHLHVHTGAIKCSVYSPLHARTSGVRFIGGVRCDQEGDLGLTLGHPAKKLSE